MESEGVVVPRKTLTTWSRENSLRPHDRKGIQSGSPAPIADPEHTFAETQTSYGSHSNFGRSNLGD